MLAGPIEASGWLFGYVCGQRHAFLPLLPLAGFGLSAHLPHHVWLVQCAAQPRVRSGLQAEARVTAEKHREDFEEDYLY